MMVQMSLRGETFGAHFTLEEKNVTLKFVQSSSYTYFKALYAQVMILVIYEVLFAFECFRAQ